MLDAVAGTALTPAEEKRMEALLVMGRHALEGVEMLLALGTASLLAISLATSHHRGGSPHTGAK
jgi:hypothetical protein